jgi:lipoprotein-releasing system permease protein
MWFLALRHLLSRKKQTFLIFMGIMLGTATYVFIAGMQLGFREFIVQQLVDNDGHIKITAHEEVITAETMTKSFFPNDGEHVSWLIPPFGKRDDAHILYPQGWFERLQNDEDILSFSEQLIVKVIAARGGVDSNGNLVGIVPEKQIAVTTLEKYMTNGSLKQIGQTGRRVVVGEGLLSKIGARVSESILLSVGGQAPVPFKIVGAFNLGIQQVDDTVIYGALRDVQQLNTTPGRVSQIAVRVADVAQAKTIAQRLGFNSHDKVQSWDEANANFLQVFRFQDIFRIVITVGLLLVASFGIYNVLSIIVNQKKREIAILRSLGYPPGDILNLFLIQGVLLGFVGAVVGLFFGFVMCIYMESLDFKVMGTGGFIISYAPTIYIEGFAMALLSSVVASILPARAASQMTPIDIIRSEG